MKTLKVPFVGNAENPSDRCVPAVLAMVLGYFMPERTFAKAEIEQMCGYIPGKATWKTQLLLSLDELGFLTWWIEDFDHHKFVANPEGYLATILDKEALDWQVKNSDLPKEAERMRQYLDRGLPLKQRKGTRQDIKDFLDDGWLVMLEVNENVIADKPGYLGHVVLVIGYDDKNVTIHNPDGNNGNKPNQVISWKLLEKAWKEYGDTYSLYAFRPMKTIELDGNNFSDIESFYDEVQKKLYANDEDWGRNLDAFNDILFGGFGVFGAGENIKLVWKNSEKSKRDLGETFNTLLEIIRNNNNIHLTLA